MTWPVTRAFLVQEVPASPLTYSRDGICLYCYREYDVPYHLDTLPALFALSTCISVEVWERSTCRKSVWITSLTLSVWYCCCNYFISYIFTKISIGTMSPWYHLFNLSLSLFSFFVFFFSYGENIYTYKKRWFMNENSNGNGYNDKIELVWELVCLILFFLLNKAWFVKKWDRVNSYLPGMIRVIRETSLFLKYSLFLFFD